MARRRYVPKTYNNRRFLRIVTTGIITLALSFVILFLILFFIFQRYVVDGQLEIPWLLDEPPVQVAPAAEQEAEEGEGSSEEIEEDPEEETT